ncbi:uncharacterized protein BX664DRAFT_380492 [Halteromyces radiatus]|uniref:uncharacterized protein n=1 Tax=Halteromyces radiatus TaxID=101107 RepID=UPI0022209FB5|nr:uncharacterized protein BX664DRAFT_380492 [Halteromyces radiatus]KAI8083167.1 hypothetical protein BX664DRAFT_380492 [Halteromyces radiatus]
MIKPFPLFFVLLSLYATIVASQHHMSTEDPPLPAFNATGEEPMSYALLPDNKGYFYTHVVFMVIAFWILMPMGVMFGIARSPFHVPVQIIAFLTSLLGYFFGHLYAHSTPHLYKGNSHHKLGWIIFLFLITQIAVGVVRKIAKAVGKTQESTTGYESLTEENIRLVRQSSDNHPSRSNSSSSNGNGGDTHSEGSMETLHHNNGNYDETHLTNVIITKVEEEHQRLSMDDEEEDIDQLLQENDPMMMMGKKQRSLWMRVIDATLPWIPQIIKTIFVRTAYNPFTKTVCRYIHSILGRIFIILIFTQTISGLVVYHGVCRSWDVLGCIAHLIKGGIFFFYGILTFGRYLGAFAERGWAWNRVDGGSKFSFEFIECSLIFIYGITNTWMEHFGKDSTWNHKDFEHASLAFMWWWCGLVGLLVESRSLRRLLERSFMNTPLDVSRHEIHQTYSLNPFPALTIMLTGISMGNHHQETQYSTNVHFMWGLLLALAALCRLCTYLSFFQNTPHSIKPSRPPTELVGAFCLIAGSILFMASNSGTMTWMRRLEVDTMFMMNVCVALTSLTLCYVAAMMILKAWAMKREQRKKARIIKRDRFVGQDV